MIMKWIEDLLKSKLSGSKADADSAKDDALWNKVSSGLSAPVPEVAGSAGKLTGLNWAVLGGAVMFAAVMGIGLILDEDASNAPGAKLEETSIASVTSVEALTPAGSSTIASESQANQADQMDKHVSADISVSGPLQQSLSALPNQEIASDIAPKPNETAVALDSSLPSTSSRMTTSEMPSPLKESTEEPSVNTTRTDANHANNLPPTESAMRKAPPLQLLPIFISDGNAEGQAVLRKSESAERVKPRHFALRAYGGVTMSNFKYKNEELLMFSDYFHTASSAAGGIVLDFEFKNQQMSIGMGWLDYAQRLEFEHTWQTEDVHPEGILSVELDPVSGDTLSVQTGPMLVTSTHHRHVRDYNHWNGAVIPIEWRKEWLISRWTLGAGLGGQLLFRTGASGKSFRAAGTVAEFDDADLSRIRMAWSPTARLYTGYQFQPEWRLDASLAAGFQRMGSLQSEELTNPSLAPWNGQLRTLQISAGVTRFFELSSSKGAD